MEGNPVMLLKTAPVDLLKALLITYDTLKLRRTFASKRGRTSDPGTIQMVNLPQPGGGGVSNFGELFTASLWQTVTQCPSIMQPIPLPESCTTMQAWQGLGKVLINTVHISGKSRFEEWELLPVSQLTGSQANEKLVVFREIASALSAVMT